MGHNILKPGFERSDERGLFREVLNDGTWEALICGSMNPGAVMGNHYHKKTLVFFYVSKGAASIKTINIESGSMDSFTLNQNEGVLLYPLESHAITFLAESDFIMLKSMKYDPADPDTYHFPVKD